VEGLNWCVKHIEDKEEVAKEALVFNWRVVKKLCYIVRILIRIKMSTFGIMLGS